MTLLLGFMNRRHAVLVSDRRLSIDGRMSEDESNKAATFVCADGRLAIAFTGLAKASGFVTNRWLLDAFAEATEADYLALPTVQRVAKLATERFKTLWAPDKRLSVLCAGYVYDAEGSRGFLALISNFERLDGQLFATPNPDFIVDWRVEKRASELGLSAAVVVGNPQAVSDEHMGALVGLLTCDKPADAIVGKAVDVLRAAADSPKAKDSIGKQCTSIVLPSNPEEDERVEYHSMTRSHILRGVSHISARGPGLGIFEIADPEREIHINNAPVPLAGPKLGRNEPCWCGATHLNGSPKKYKRCHGR
jgi:hypothetical protein